MKDIVLVFSIFVRIAVAFVAFTYVLAQFFFGDFQWDASIVGLGALAVAVLTGLPVKHSASLTRVGIFGGAAALVGIGAGIFTHYAYYDIPGNYYAWFITVPFASGIVFLMIAAQRGVTLR